MSTDRATWERDLQLFFEKPVNYGYEDPFFRTVALPMWLAHRAFRRDPTPEGCNMAVALLVECCSATDWRRAGTEWLLRRRAQRVAKLERGA
jgi:hypothetical protein